MVQSLYRQTAESQISYPFPLFPASPHNNGQDDNEGAAVVDGEAQWVSGRVGRLRLENIGYKVRAGATGKEE